MNLINDHSNSVTNNQRDLLARDNLLRIILILNIRNIELSLSVESRITNADTSMSVTCNGIPSIPCSLYGYNIRSYDVISVITNK